MNIVVCVKQVPNVAQIKFNNETKTIVREGVTLQTSSLDRRAVTQAVRMKEAHGGTVTVVTMGPPSAKAVLSEAMAAGADRAVHLNDRAFAGSDTLATARALAAAIKKIGFDLVICGRFTNDSETGQVGPEVAELLGVPQATNARKVEYDEKGNQLIVHREVEDGLDVYEVKLPALMTAGEFLNVPIRPTPEQLEAAKSLPIEEWTAADLGLAASDIGAAGSPTSVSEIRELVIPRGKVVVKGDDPNAAAEQLVDFLLDSGMFTPWQRAMAGPPVRSMGGNRTGRAIWVVAEHTDTNVRGFTFELLGKGAQLAAQLNSEVAAVLIGHNVTQFADTLASYGADRVYVADHADLAHHHTSHYAQILADAIVAYKPYAVLFGASVNGRDLAPRVAARLGLGLTGDCIGLEIDEQERLVQLKPAFGGNIVAPILSRTTPAMATVRPGVLDRLQSDPGRKAIVEQLPVGNWSNGQVRYVSSELTAGNDGIDIEDAEILVGIGAGIQADGVPLIRELATVAGGTIAASLRTVANGVLPGPLQIGLTGRAVAPRFYVAVAIQGALNHMIGVQKAEHIVAINNDPEAAIFSNCDFGIVGDYKTVVPAVIERLKAARAEAVH